MDSLLGKTKTSCFVFYAIKLIKCKRFETHFVGLLSILKLKLQNKINVNQMYKESLISLSQTLKFIKK